MKPAHSTAILLCLVFPGTVYAQGDSKPVPRFQAIPLPREEVSLQRDGIELGRYYFGPEMRRPFVYPVIGPSGRSLTRMGHPHDPSGHSHHNSFWVAHHDVDGTSFWDDQSGRIVHRQLIKFEDSETSASVLSRNAWIDPKGRELLKEKRQITLEALDSGESLLILDLQLEASLQKPVTLGKTAFGLVGVRMAKSIGVNDGGGAIRNSEGNIGEQGPNGVFWKHARWVDYSGPITNDKIEGITLLDHPKNPGHPTAFHVRGDGWMGTSLTLDAARAIEPGKPLRLRYALYVHSGAPTPDAINHRWKQFAATSVKELPDK